MLAPLLFFIPRSDVEVHRSCNLFSSFADYTRIRILHTEELRDHRMISVKSLSGPLMVAWCWRERIGSSFRGEETKGSEVSQDIDHTRGCCTGT